MRYFCQQRNVSREKVSDIPGFAGFPDIPDFPDFPDFPGIPDIPDFPGIPDFPDFPASRFSPAAAQELLNSQLSTLNSQLSTPSVPQDEGVFLLFFLTLPGAMEEEAGGGGRRDGILQLAIGIDEDEVGIGDYLIALQQLVVAVEV